MKRMAARSTGPPATYDTLVTVPTVSRKASPTRTIVCRLHGWAAVTIGARPRYHSTVAQPRNAMVRSSAIRHRSVPPVVMVGTRRTAQRAIPKPMATHAAAGNGIQIEAAAQVTHGGRSEHRADGYEDIRDRLGTGADGQVRHIPGGTEGGTTGGGPHIAPRNSL